MGALGAQEQQLIDAVKAGDARRIEQLLASDPALVNVESQQGVTLVLIALYYGKPDIAALLVDRGARIGIFEAAALGDVERVRRLVQAHPEMVNAYAADGFQPLGLACFFAREDVVSLLLAYGAQVNAPSSNAQKVMPLHSAVASHQLTIVQALLEHGAKVNARQAGDFTPLHGAAQNGELEIVQVLLQHGADVHTLSADGRKPEDMARAGGHVAVVELLQQQG